MTCIYQCYQHSLTLHTECLGNKEKKFDITYMKFKNMQNDVIYQGIYIYNESTKYEIDRTNLGYCLLLRRI